MWLLRYCRWLLWYSWWLLACCCVVAMLSQMGSLGVYIWMNTATNDVKEWPIQFAHVLFPKSTCTLFAMSHCITSEAVICKNLIWVEYNKTPGSRVSDDPALTYTMCVRMRHSGKTRIHRHPLWIEVKVLRRQNRANSRQWPSKDFNIQYSTLQP